jgi:signal recognition particle subunit SRP19
MVAKDEQYIVIYPLYFDSSLSRSEGRKVAKKHDIEKPTVDMVAKAAKSLHLHPHVEKDKSHPSRHWKNEGRVLVEKKEAKTKLLKQLANYLQ